MFLSDYVYYGSLIFDHDREFLERAVVAHHQDADAAVGDALRTLREGRLVATAQQGPFGEPRRLSPAFWQSVAWADVNWQLSALPKYGLIAIRIEEAPTTPRRRGPKPEIRTAVRAVFCRWAKDEDLFALASGMSQEGRRAAVGKALGLSEDEYPSRSYVQGVWEELLPELKLRQTPAT